MVASARSVGWGSNEVLTLLYLIGQVLWCAVGKQNFQKHSCFMPLIGLSIHKADNSVLPVLFVRSLSILSGCPIINNLVATRMWSYLELYPWHIIHILGFITTNFLPVCLIMVALAIFQAWICVGVGIGKYLIFIQWLVWMYHHKEELQEHNLCILCIFCIARSPLSDFCNIHLHFSAVGREHEVYWELL
jgi:hypothetical protein